MLGCDWKYCLNSIDMNKSLMLNTGSISFSGLADFGNGLNDVECSMFVRDVELGPTNDFSQVIEKLNKK